jgi:hypothetical protein
VASSGIEPPTKKLMRPFGRVQLGHYASQATFTMLAIYVKIPGKMLVSDYKADATNFADLFIRN